MRTLSYLVFFVVVGLTLWPVLAADDWDKTQLWTTLAKEKAEQSDRRVSVSSFADLIESARPAVVSIHVVRKKSAKQDRPDFVIPWQLPDRQAIEQGVGSGFIIHQDGYIVTNQHVIADAHKLTVRVMGIGNPLKARLVGADARSDLALLKIRPPKPLKVLPFGSSESMAEGSWVVAIGNPFGMTAIATKGIISGKGRTLGVLLHPRAGYFDFIQTDANIDFGNSGGPLLNTWGEVVGINTAIESRARGIGFAVPVDLAKAVLPHLIKHGHVVRGYLGVRIDELSWELAESFGWKHDRGALITKVIADTPAEMAGLKKGDIITRFAGHRVKGKSDMTWRVSTIPAGKSIEIEVFRDRHLKLLTVIPRQRSSKKEKALPQKTAIKEKKQLLPQGSLGLKVVGLDEETALQAGFAPDTQGVVVVGVKDAAELAGLRLGDIITSVNDCEVSSVSDFTKAVSAISTGKMIRFYVLRQKAARYVALLKDW
jgi:serine protease Do